MDDIDYAYELLDELRDEVVDKAASSQQEG